VAVDADQRLFVRKGEKAILVLVAYVDDFEVYGPNASKPLDTAGTYLQQQFDLKNVPYHSNFLDTSFAHDYAALELAALHIGSVLLQSCRCSTSGNTS
jgi:hypothetical protein